VDILLRKLVLGIDFNNILFNSYYGDKLVNSNGINVNAIRQFFFKLKSLKDSLEPDYIIMANDIGRDKTFRRKLYKPYKAQRKPADPDVITQLRYASQIAALLGYPFINNELYEADDILGMISRYTQENDMDMIIASSDKDLYQLIDDNVYIFSPRGKELIDRGWLHDRYNLTPSQWIELKVLQGDRSDNIPGVNGVGEATALKLLHEYNSIENIYSHLNSIKPSLRECLKTGYDNLNLTRELVTIVTDYTKIEFSSSMIENTGRYVKELYDLLEELELHSLYNVMKYSLLLDKPPLVA